jgi:hypothetical protein
VPVAHQLRVGVNLNKLIRGEIRQQHHQSHNLLAFKQRPLPAACQVGSKATLASREMRPTKRSYVQQGNRMVP